MYNKFYYLLYKNSGDRIKTQLFKIIRRIEGWDFLSTTLRKIMLDFYNVEIGMYSYGSCFTIGNFDRNTKIGRYCSFAENVRVINRNHPMNKPSTHPYFYNTYFGYCEEEKVEYNRKEIGNDVWIGHSAIILPSCNRIGTGAVIGAGSIVTKDIPPYAIVAGNPATVIKYRFTKDQINELLLSKWWEKNIEELSIDKKFFKVEKN